MLAGRPWIEATALLAAAGFSTAPIKLSPDLETDMRHPRYALLPKLNATSELVSFDTLDALADHIEGMRFGQGLQLKTIDNLRQQAFENGGRHLHLSRGRDRGLQVFTTMLDGELDRSLGFAWLNGQGHEVLQQALSAAARRRADSRRLPTARKAAA